MKHAFFSKYAISLRKVDDERIVQLHSINDFIEIWENMKVVHLSQLDDLLVWRRENIIPGKRYVIWGTGLAGSFLADAVNSSGGVLVFAIDNDDMKKGMEFYGAIIYKPDFLISNNDRYDYLIIGHYSRFEEIKKEAILLDVPSNKILMPYEV